MAIFDIGDGKGGSYYLKGDSFEDIEQRLPDNHFIYGKVNEIIECDDSVINAAILMQ